METQGSYSWFVGVLLDFFLNFILTYYLFGFLVFFYLNLFSKMTFLLFPCHAQLSVAGVCRCPLLALKQINLGLSASPLYE